MPNQLTKCQGCIYQWHTCPAFQAQSVMGLWHTSDPFLFKIRHSLLTIKLFQEILKPTLQAFINNLKQIYEVDNHVQLMEMTNEEFVRKRTPYNHLVTWMCLTTFVCTSVNLTWLTCVLLETMYAHTHISVYLLCFSAMITKYDM